MTTWLVRKTGSDSNGGTSASVRSSVSDGVTNGTNTLTSASNPWVAGDVGHGITIAGTWRLVATFVNAGSITFGGATIASGSGKAVIVGGALLTIGKALASGSIVAAGDSIYVGSGVYREVVTAAISGTAGNVISLIGDVDGAQTGDSGDVQWTGYTTNDKTAPSASANCLLNTQNYLTFDSLVFVGTARAINGGATTSHDITVQRCAFLTVAPSGQGQVIDILTTASTLANWLIDRCVFWNMTASGGGTVRAVVAQNGTADFNHAITVQNCAFILGAAPYALSVAPTGALAFRGGGVTFQGNSVFGGNTSVEMNYTGNGGLYPVVLANNVVHGNSNFVFVAAASAGAAVEDSNFFAGSSGRTNVGIGPNTVGTNAYAALYEIGQSLLTGRLIRPYGQPAGGSPVLGFGNVSLAVGIPGTAADDSTVGTISWGTPNNSKYPNDSNVATAALTAGATSHYLKLTNFGFAIPAGATITQIRVEILMNKNAGTGLLAGTGNSCKLTKDGTTFIGTDKGTSLPVPTTTNAIYSVGTAGDLWGSTWVPADLNSANFGVGISFKETGGSNAVTPQVDYVRIIINYTPTSLPTAQTQDLTSGRVGHQRGRRVRAGQHRDQGNVHDPHREQRAQAGGAGLSGQVPRRGRRQHRRLGVPALRF